MMFSCLAGNSSIEVLINKATELSKSNLHKTRLDIKLLKAKQILSFLLYIYIVTKQNFWINLITNDNLMTYRKRNTRCFA